MTPLVLATRMAARRRRMILRSAIPLGAAAFFLVLASSLLLSVREQVSDYERLHLTGELAGPSGESFDPPEDDHILVSTIFSAPALVSNGTETALSMVTFADVEQELAFRGMTAQGSDNGLATPGLPAGDLTVTLPEVGSIPVAPHRTDELVSQNPVIILPREMLPGSTAAGGNTVTRIRGQQPLSDDEAAALAAETGLSLTGWRNVVRERMSMLWALALALGGLLLVAGAFATAPSVSIMVRRYASEFRLLAATGYSSRWISTSVAAMGGLAGAVASAVGAIAAALVITIGGMRGGFDPSFLPLTWMEANPTPGALLPGPPVIPAAIVIVAGTIAGAISALPSTRLVATLQAHEQP